MPCGSFFTHLSDWPDYDTEDLVNEVEKVKRGEKKSKKDIKRIAKTILRQTPDMSVYVYRTLDGHRIDVPSDTSLAPDRELLDWHNRNVFIA